MFYLFLLAHLVADFVLQPSWLVARKRHWDGLLIHGGIVLLCMIMLPLAEPTTMALWPIMLTITAIHILIDRSKVCYGHYVPGPPIVPFLLDQLCHITVLAVALSLALPIEHVWLLNGSPVFQVAIYAIVYVVAAFATPIAVMIWLDPSFGSKALTLGARMRSMFTGIVAVSITLFIGIFAPPAMLLGLIFATRHPHSSHPLDTPTGVLTVLWVASLLSTVLIVVAV